MIQKSSILILLPIALYVLSCWIAAAVYGVADEFKPLFYMGTALKFALVLAFLYFDYRCLRAFWIMLRVRPANLTRYLWDDLKRGPFNKERWIQAFPIFIGMAFFFSSFTSMKMLIPRFQPYVWDEFFANLDEAIHFGMAPWELFQPLLGYAPVTFAISFVYILWLGVLFLMLYWQLFSTKNPELRARFFLTFVLSWAIQGTLMAIIFASVGPCFYEGLLDSARFVPLMEYLREINETYPVWALNTQDMLWGDYTSNKLILGGGISAFPSIHVATAFLFMLLGWRTSKIVGWLTTIFFAFILIGSFHLGWHYAVDGYASIIVTFIIWKTSGYLTRKTL
jgi:hypothetical protein